MRRTPLSGIRAVAPLFRDAEFRGDPRLPGLRRARRALYLVGAVLRGLLFLDGGGHGLSFRRLKLGG